MGTERKEGREWKWFGEGKGDDTIEEMRERG
jgi:hypothetical protein